jgi:cellulose biosynthesis protein BcsQ
MLGPAREHGEQHPLIKRWGRLMVERRKHNRHKARRIAIFNHKGGVGKTTLTVNIAAALASLGKRILLVDADPQCNLSSYLIEEAVVDDLLDASDTSKGETLWSAMKPISEATGDINKIDPFELSLENIFLLPGDIRLSEFEQDLTHMWNECFQRKIKGYRGTSAISLLVNYACSARNIDFVFYDCGPNIGPLNRAVLLDCDSFIVPAACDLFSLRALKTLGHTLSQWIKEWQIVAQLAPDDLYLIPGRPAFLGYIPQRFRVYRGEVAAGYTRYLSQIEKHVNSDIVTVLRRIDRGLAPVSVSARLGQIKDFGTIANASQRQGVPMHEVNAGTQSQKQEAYEAFMAIAKKILARSMV